MKYLTFTLSFVNLNKTTANKYEVLTSQTVYVSIEQIRTNRIPNEKWRVTVRYFKSVQNALDNQDELKIVYKSNGDYVDLPDSYDYTPTTWASDTMNDVANDIKNKLNALTGATVTVKTYTP